MAQVIGSFVGGGAQRVPYDLACGLAAHGVPSVGIAIRELGDQLDFRRAGVEFIELGETRSSWLSLAMAARRLGRLLSDRAVDVVHVHGTRTLPMVIAAAKLCERPPRVCFTWHDSGEVLENGTIRRRILSRCLSGCAWVSGSSRDVASRLTRNGRLSGVGVFHGGVQQRPLRAIRSPAPQQIAWVARLSHKKDPQILLRALHRLRAEELDVTAVFAGAPYAHASTYRDETLALVEQLGLKPHASFVGKLSRPEVDELLDRSSIGVQTSHTEGLSIALMEQMMAGLAIVATDVGDTSVAIQHEETGLLIPPRDEDALYTALRRLITDPELRRRLGEAAREAAVRQFSIEAMTANALREYERIVGEHAHV